MITTLYFLGTGAAMPLNRGLPCIALRVDSNIYVFDIGEGCQHRLFKSGLGVAKIKSIFITHLHGDHYLGLFGLFQSMHLSGRRDKLVIIAPSQLSEVIKAYRSSGLLHLTYPVEFTTINDGLVYEDNKIRVYAFPVEHGIEAYGFKIVLYDKKNTTIIYTGDTRPCNRVLQEALNADILIHEATFTSDMASEAYSQGHSTARDAAIIASKAGVKLLVLTHISARYSDPKVLFYDGYRFFHNLVVAEDYMLIRI